MLRAVDLKTSYRWCDEYDKLEVKGLKGRVGVEEHRAGNCFNASDSCCWSFLCYLYCRWWLWEAAGVTKLLKITQIYAKWYRCIQVGVFMVIEGE